SRLTQSGYVQIGPLPVQAYLALHLLREQGTVRGPWKLSRAQLQYRSWIDWYDFILGILNCGVLTLISLGTRGWQRPVRSCGRGARRFHGDGSL
ncbi:MAG TPA: hypothetical protein VMJ32_10105, partial [Pirellulales bacterium]|nr:hypothetical protein [Pirellulales bacterium]